MPLIQLDENKFIVYKRHDGRERDGEKHTRHTEDSSADHDADENPHAGYAEQCAEQLRFQHISVNRLQYNRKNNKPERGPWIFQHENQRADDAADDRSEGRRKVCDADNHRDQNHIRHSGDGHEHRIGDTDDQGINQIADDEPDQYPVAAAPENSRIVIGLLLHAGAEQSLEPVQQPLLVQQKVNGDDTADDPAHHILPDGNRRIHNGIHISGQLIQQRIQHIRARREDFGKIDP